MGIGQIAGSHRRRFRLLWRRRRWRGGYPPAIATLAEIVVRETEWGSPHLLPELRLRMASDAFVTWTRTEAEDLPYWAFAWAGGQALARFLLDRPELVRNQRVLDLGSGSGVVALAAALAGARDVVACDSDPLALAAIELNAVANGVEVRALAVGVDDPTLAAEEPGVLLAGDVFYEPKLAALVEPVLRREAARGALVLVGDPGRGYRPQSGLTPIASYEVPGVGSVEARDTLSVAIFQVGRVGCGTAG